MKQDGLVTKLPPLPISCLMSRGERDYWNAEQMCNYGHACIEAYIEWQLEQERRVEAIFKGPAA